MTDTLEFIDDFFSHYSSRYDPVKAHEYYLRTRELKGRRSVSQLKSKKKKEGWAYVKNQVETEQKAALQNSTQSNKKTLDTLRSTAKAKREEIQSKLKELEKTLTAEDKNKARQDAANQRSQVASDLQTSLEKARANYKTARQKIKDKYEAELNKEFDSIRTGV